MDRVSLRIITDFLAGLVIYLKTITRAGMAIVVVAEARYAEVCLCAKNMNT